MGVDKKLLFGIDESDFARQALAKGSRKNKFTFWHLIFRSFLADFKE